MTKSTRLLQLLHTLRHRKHPATAAARYHIPHPMRLASNPQLKRSAWETLQKLQAALK